MPVSYTHLDVYKRQIHNSPNANQVCTVTCYTYNGGTHIGTKSTTFTVYCYSPSKLSSTSGSTIGSLFSMNISRSSGLFTHSLWYSFGSKTWQGIGNGICLLYTSRCV